MPVATSGPIGIALRPRSPGRPDKRESGGVLLTVTGTVGGLLFAAWAGADKLWSMRGRTT